MISLSKSDAKIQQKKQIIYMYFTDFYTFPTILTTMSVYV